MIVPVLLLSLACGVIGSGVHHELEAAPVVTASSSQYFERTYNRLVAQPVVPAPPLQAVPVAHPPPIHVVPVAYPPPIHVVPVAPSPPLHVFPVSQAPPVAPAPPVVVEATRTTAPASPTAPPQPADPNIAIAIATAHAAAPVATFLLPPYPFGFPPGFGLAPQPSDTNFNTEPTTPTSTTVQTTEQQEATTALPSNINTSFAQALPSNENVNFQTYGLPLPRQKPQKLKTSVEVVPVPLAYIAPPPLDLNHHHGHHLPLKGVPHVHTYIPKTTKIIIRPVSYRTRVVRVPASRKMLRNPQNIRSRSRDVEEITSRPINRPATKPPRL